MIDLIEFRKLISSKKTFVIRFVAPGCPNCMMMEPMYSQMAKTAMVNFYEIDGETEIEKLLDFSIMSFPTTVTFVNGVETARFSGFMNMEQIAEFYMAGINIDKVKLTELTELEKTAVQCGTISAIEVKEGKLIISFWDGSVKAFKNVSQEVVKHILDINGTASIGHFYRTEIKGNYDQEEIQSATNNKGLKH